MLGETGNSVRHATPPLAGGVSVFWSHSDRLLTEIQLPHKAVEVVVFEVIRQDLLGKLVGVHDHKCVAILVWKENL